MDENRIQNIRTLIDRHFPAANHANAEVPEYEHDPQDFFALGRPFSTRLPLSFRDKAVRVFDALLEGCGDEVDAVTKRLKDEGLLYKNGPKDENALCYIEQVEEHFRIRDPWLFEGYLGLSVLDEHFKTARYCKAGVYAQEQGVPVAFADRILWELSKGRETMADLYLEAGKKALDTGTTIQGTTGQKRVPFDDAALPVVLTRRAPHFGEHSFGLGSPLVGAPDPADSI